MPSTRTMLKDVSDPTYKLVRVVDVTAALVLVHEAKLVVTPVSETVTGMPTSFPGYII